MWWLVLGLVACGGGAPEGHGPRGKDGGDEPKREPVVVVQTAPVSRGVVIDALLASAVVESTRAADVTPEAAGTVIRVTKDIGDTVRTNELLAVIDNQQLDVGVERARSEVDRLAARVTELEALAGQGAVSSREVADVRDQLASARTALKEAKVNAAETQLHAPFAGVVAVRDIRVGELASAGRRAFQIVDPHDLRVNASLPERDVARVRPDQHAQLTAAYDPSLKAEATVTRISPVIDSSSGTFQVTLTLDDQRALRPGQFVNVALEVDRHDGALVVPRPAVVYDNGRPVVYRVKPAPPEEAKEEEEKDDEEEGPGWLAALFGGGDEAEEEAEDEKPAEDEGPKLVVERVDVKLGLVDVERAEILSGLTDGDPIVIVGQANLKDGARVREPKAVASTPADGEGAPQ